MADGDFTKYIKGVQKVGQEVEKAKKKTQNLNKTFRNQKDILIALVNGQNTMIKSLEKVASATNRSAKVTKRASRQTLLWTKHTRILGGSLAVLRSKLLVASFGMALVERSVGRLVDEFGNFEDSQNRIRKAIDSTNMSAGVTAEQVFAMNTRIEETTGIAETLVNQSSALLLTFTNLGESVFPQTQTAVLDMAAAMYQGNITLDNMRSITIQVGKALNNPLTGLTALTRVGVVFTERQKNVIKMLVNTNQLAKAQGIILAELNKEFGGQSNIEGYSKTVREFNTALGNLQKDIGRELRPMVEALLKSMTELMETFETDKLYSFTTQMTTMVAAVLGAKKIMLLLLAANASNIKSFTKLGKVLAIQGRNFVGLTASMRKATLGIKAMTVATRLLSGPAGWFLLAAAAVPKLTNMFNKQDTQLESNNEQLEMYSKSLERIDKEVKTLEGGQAQVSKMREIFGKDWDVDLLDMGEMFTTTKTEKVDRFREKLQKLRDELEFTNTVMGGGGETAQITSEVDKLSQKYDNLRFVLEASHDEQGRLMDKNKMFAETILKLNLRVQEGTDELLNYKDALDKLPESVKKSIEAFDKAADAQRLRIQTTKDEIELEQKKSTMYVEIADSIASTTLNIIDTSINKQSNARKDQFDLERKLIEDTVKNEETKRKKLEEIDKKEATHLKEMHNKGLLLKAAELSMNFSQSIARINIAVQTALANAEMIENDDLRNLRKNTINTTKSMNVATATASYITGLAGIYAQKLARGGDFVTSGPQMIMVGDNPGGRERVQVTPLSSPNIDGPQGASVVVNVSGNLMSSEYVEGELAEQIKTAIRRGSDFGIS